MHDLLKDIRKRLRLAMNGVVSGSMREKGVSYKLNFGVSVPKIREIAQTYTPDPDLAEALWAEDVREMKIMATLLYPKELFTIEKARQWGSAVNNQEIAEQYCFNLLQELPYADILAAEWITEKEEFLQVTGFLLFARLCMKEHDLRQEHITLLVHEAKKILDNGLPRIQRSALLALKRFGRQSAEQRKIVLETISDYENAASPEKQEYYADVKFELDYYL